MIAPCDACGTAGPAQLVWVGEHDEEQTRCEHCAGDRWRRPVVTAELAGVVADLQRYYDAQADTEFQRNRFVDWNALRGTLRSLDRIGAVGEPLTPTDDQTLDEVDAYLDEHADADYGEVIDGVPEVIGNVESGFLSRLRHARGET